jgi:hypothetical protein
MRLFFTGATVILISGPDGRDWRDNHRRFALLGWVAAHLAAGELDQYWQPEVVHAHDWHAGLAPAYIAQNPALSTATVFTIHNLAFRGLFPLDYHHDLGLLISGAGSERARVSRTVVVHEGGAGACEARQRRQPDLCPGNLYAGIRLGAGRRAAWSWQRSVGHSQWCRLFGLGSQQRPRPEHELPCRRLRGKKVCKLKLQADLNFAVVPRRRCSRWSVA